MKKANVAGGLLTLVLLAGCQPDRNSQQANTAMESTSADAQQQDSVAEADGHQATTDNPVEVSVEMVASGNGIELDCGGNRVRIRYVHGPAEEAGSTVGRATELTLVKAGTVTAIPLPEEMTGYAAVALACEVSATDKKAYFFVQYGEAPVGCQFCEWFYLYDQNGTSLTRSKPAILTDSSLPEGKQDLPNNREYEVALARLGLTHPEFMYLE